MSVRRDQDPPSQSWILGYLGQEIRVRREAAGITQAELGRYTHCSGKLVSAYESGTRVPQRAFVELADRVLEAGGSLVRLWREMTEQSHPIWFRRYVQLEKAATQIRQFEPTVIPGLLQTEAYARALLSIGQPPLPPRKIAEVAEARIARQHLLHGDDPAEAWFVMDEVALRRWPHVDEKLAREQLGKLVEVGRLPHVKVLVIPLDHGLHLGALGPMTLLSFSEGEDCGYVETMGGGMIISDPTSISTLRRSYDVLLTDALSVDKTEELVLSLRERL